MGINNRIKELTQNLGISSKELSKQTGIPYDSLKNYEYGRREPTGTALVALEKFFGVSGAYILGEADTAAPVYAWDDDKIKETISDNFSPLIHKILTATSEHTDFEQKMIFDILVEIRHIAEMNDVNKRTEILSFLQSTIAKSNKLIDALNTEQKK